MILALSGGCEGEDSTPLDTGSAYFPLNKGIYQIYAVNEVRYSALAEPVASSYELMVEVVDSFPSAQGQYTYVIHRSRRSTEIDSWEILDTWSARKDSREAIVSEGNTAFVKVIFPVRTGTRWNGNAFNTLGIDEYVLTNIHQSFGINGMTFENTFTVEQERNEDLIVFNDERREVYALDVGLVYKKIIQLNYCTDEICIGKQKIENGLEIQMVIKQYGKH